MAGRYGADGSEPAEDLGLTDALVELSFLVQLILGRIAADHGLSIAQVRVLGVLRDREPGMQQLAHHLHLDKSSVSGLIDRAEQKGLVKRVAATQDGRAVLVSSTAKGRKIMAQIEENATHEFAGLAATLSQRERNQLSQLASRLVLSESRAIDM
jgi:DNA-binding MarR family transcriptional regulator